MKNLKKSKKISTEKPLTDKLIEQYKRGYDALSSIRSEWEEKEAILLGKTLDKETESSKAKVFDPKLSTYLFERASRVMAQNPTGKVQAFTKQDKGKNIILNILLKDYVLPNANSQFDFLTKTRLLDLYSNVYGSFAVQVDWVVKEDYVGPDFYLIPIRNIVFQPGIRNFEDSDYVFIRSVVSRAWLLSRDTKTWKNIDKLLEMPHKFEDEKSYVERISGVDNYTYSKEDADTFEIITKFEKDRWITFSKDGKLILRDIENPQKNGKLPVVMKHCFPLIDRIIGLGEIERLKTLQYSINSLINLYLEGAKMSIFPPLLINPTLSVLRTLQYSSGAKWLVKGQGAVQQLPLSPLGLNTFTQTYSFLNAAILNALGTTDTTVTKEIDPGMGKSQPYSEKVLTPEGWKKMGEIKEGEYVFGSDGLPKKILKIYEQGELDVYTLYFNDGSSVRCSLDHLWTVYNKNNHNKKQTISVKEMLDYGLYHKGYSKKSKDRVYNFKVDLVKPIDFPDKDIPIHPYLLGLIIGDGGFTEGKNIISFTNSKEKIQQAVKTLLPDESIIYSKNNGRDNEFRIKGKIISSLKNLGLFGKLSKEKFIPDIYLYNSIEKRKQLLQGLIDTDGYIIKHLDGNYSVEYTTVSEKLAYNFIELARSLGYFVRLTVGNSKRYNKIYGKKYRIYITKRKKTIINIKKTGKEKCRCILIDSNDHLYVTSDFILTHNTPRALSMLQMRESSRDNWDRFMMERALEKILDRFVDLLTKRQEKPIKVYLSKEDIDAIKSINPDVVEMFESGKYGQLIIKPDEAKNVNCRFFIDAGSTLKKDEMLENETLTTILGFIFKIPGAIEQIQQTGKVRLGDVSINFGELFKRWIITSGTQDWDKIVSQEEQPPQQNFENDELQNIIANAPQEIQVLLNQYGRQNQQNPVGQPDTSNPGFQSFEPGETAI